MRIIYLFVVLLLVGCTQPKTAAMTPQPHSLNNPISRIAPPYLKQGDSVAIVAPGGILKDRYAGISAAETLLKSWGLVPVLGQYVFAQNHHFAGTDENRLSDLQWALDDPKVKAVWCARGGYGSMRIIDQLNFESFKESPKWIVGYSDITTLHNKINGLGIESIHGMMAVNMELNDNDIQHSIESLKKGLFGQLHSYKIIAHDANKFGQAQGILVGGNLTLLAAQLGSKTQLDTQNKILFIEEIGEYKYHIDRMLQSLKRAGYFEDCAGIIVGDMTQIKANTTVWGSSTAQLILDVLEDYNFPIAFGFPAGHESENRALIFGRNINLDVNKTSTKITF